MKGRSLGIRAACLQFRGDWPWLSAVFAIATHMSNELCFLCGADFGGTTPCTDPSHDAAWVGTRQTHIQFMNDRLRNRKYVSGVSRWPGFILLYIVLDLMHMADLGITQYCLGNVLFELFLELGGVLGRPLPTMARLVAFLKDAAIQLGVTCPVTALALTHIRREKDLVPCLKMKAAKTRSLAPIVLQLLRSHFPPQNERENVRMHCVRQVVVMYDEFKAWKPGSAAIVADCCRRHELLYMELARLEIARVGAEHWLRWRWFPKHHMMLHLTKEQAEEFGNPACFWNYADERAIGTCVDLAESSHVGTLSDTTMQKYRADVWATLCAS